MTFIPKIRSLAKNLAGRDFVVGDLHGCLPDLIDILREVDFDPSKDRLLSVGDLADRGPDSWGCLALLAEPWFYAVKGNHEDLLLDHLGISPSTIYYSPFDFENNGGGWYESKKRPENAGLLLSLVADLPHVLVVGNDASDGRFHVVHGELSVRTRDWGLHVFDDREIDRWRVGIPSNFSLKEDEILWERKIFSGGGGLEKRIPVLSPTFCGHTIVDDVTVRASHIDLDTGAFLRHWGRKSGKLTVVEARSFIGSLG